MTTTPRIRKDLHVATAEEEGVAYVDVTDPRSGGTMRLYDFEWRIAEQMDGRRSFDDVAAWAGGTFEWRPSPDDLAAYARALGELGFVDGDVALAATSAGAAEGRGAGPSAGGRGADDGVLVAHTPEAATMQLPTVEAPPASGAPAADRPAATAAAAAATARSSEATVMADRPTELLAPVRDDAPPVPSSAPPATPATPVAAASPPPTPTPSTPPERETAARDVAARAPAAPEVAAPAVGSGSTRLPPPPVGTSPTMLHTEPKPTSRITLAIIALVLVVAAVLAYVYVIGPSLKAAPVGVQVVPAPSTVVRYYDGEAPVQQGDINVLAFEQPGKVVEVVAAGTEAAPGSVLARLDGYQAVQRELTDTQGRLKYYQDQLKQAQATGNVGAIKGADEKVKEKLAKLAELETRLRKTEIVTARGGKVSEVLVTSGADVKLGDKGVKMVDRRLLVEFKLAPSEAGAMKVGQAVRMQPSSATVKEAAMVNGRVVSVGPAEVKVEVPDGEAKPGDTLRLVRARFDNVVKVPASAVSKSQGGVDQVYVDVGGIAKARPVVVADKSRAEALLSAGIGAGDKLIVTYPEDLQDGQKVATAK